LRDVAAQIADRKGLKLVGRGGWMPGRRDNAEAEQFYQYALSLKKAGKLDTIIAASRWSMYAVGFPAFEPQEYGNRFFSRNGILPSTQAEMTETWKATMTDFLSDFAGVNIVVLLQVPQFPFFPPKDMAMQELGLRLRPLPAKSLEDHKRDNAVVNEFFRAESARYPRLKIVDPASVLCNETQCFPRLGNKSLYYDDDHISAFGATLLQPLLSAAVGNRSPESSDRTER
jgi:hypothetical protein